nr:MAG TPA: hypothetical protein [Caudoviricetes sp.]
MGITSFRKHSINSLIRSAYFSVNSFSGDVQLHCDLVIHFAVNKFHLTDFHLPWRYLRFLKHCIK